MFTHLHVHTEYSLLDGASRIADLVSRAKELGMTSLAITDHGVMYGVIDFYKECKKQGIKPIIGAEAYVATRSRFDKQSGIDSSQNHLTLLAKNMIGYRNLISLISNGFIEGFYYKPRIDNQLLKEKHEGIIALSGCLSGAISKSILNNNYANAKEIALFYNELFGQNNFYLEIQSGQTREQILVNNEIIKLSRELKIPLVLTNDVHYIKKEDSKTHEILLCIQMGKTIHDEDRMVFGSNDYYLKSYEEMLKDFSYVPDAIENTNKIADICNVEFEFGKIQLPKFDVPNGYTAIEYLEKLCYDGVQKKYNTKEEIEERLSGELKIIKSMGFVDYFLIVWDYVRFCNENEIMVGPGRGSAAGSIVAYVLNITNIDPIKYNLVFERFLNPERITMPDIDIDFCYERRQEVIDYVVSKYGQDRVAQIITFGTLAARAAIRDVGRALDMRYSDVDFLAKKIPFEINMTIKKALEINSELKEMYDSDQKTRELIDTAKAIEGMPRHSSTHAAGVVISEKPIIDLVPVQKYDEVTTTQFSFTTLEELGILKMDFLGLRTLTVIRDTISLIKNRYNICVDLYKIDLEDQMVYKDLREGKSIGVFQLESTGLRRLLKELKPNCIEDIIAGVALYRPGPMEQIPTYIKNKSNPESVKYLHPTLEKILNVTYGCMVYQEQVLQIVRELAGYSMGRADLVRRVMSKKKMSVMLDEKKNFIHGIIDENGNIVVEGAIRKGISEDIADKIFNQMIDFASYAFNKAHSACYAIIAYQTAWLKHYYPREYMTSLLNSFINNSDKIIFYIQECKKLNIDILLPHINKSQDIFIVEDEGIRFGLGALKNVGVSAIKSLNIQRRENGDFLNFEDFCTRFVSQDINKRCVESLIKSGTFDCFGIYRSQLIAIYERVIDGLGENKRKNYDGQLSIFDSSQGLSRNSIAVDVPDIEEYPLNTILIMEKEVSGLYLSGHPLSQFEYEINNRVTATSIDFRANDDVPDGVLHGSDIMDNENVIIGGVLVQKKVKYTKNNKVMAFVDIEDKYGTIEVIIFPRIYEKYHNIIIEDQKVFISGKFSIKDDEPPKLICEKIEVMRKTMQDTRKLYLKYDTNEKLDKASEILKMSNGNVPVYVYNQINRELQIASKDMWVRIGDKLLCDLKIILGDENVKIVQ